jgi:hypothetical protein
MSKVVCGILGLFEFFAAYDFFINAETKVVTDRLYPAILASDDVARVVFCTWLVTLGCQRLTYATSKPTVGSWLSLIITHVAELAMWYYFAMLPSFRGSMTMEEMVVEVASLKSVGGVHACICLIGVPILILSFIINFPKGEKKSKSH